MATNDHPSTVQLPTSLTSTPTMRYFASHGPDPRPSVYIGMDQLGFFLGMLEWRLNSYLDDEARERFWQVICEDCPELMSIIEAQREPCGLLNFNSITFSYQLFSRAFDSKERE